MTERHPLIVMAGLVPAIHESVAIPSLFADIGAMEGAWVYIMTNRPNGTLYTGVTSNLARRAWEHREGIVDGFTKRYGLKRLVYAEPHTDIQSAIQREHNMKHWSRTWKVRLILAANPTWADLYDQLNGVVDGRDEPGHDELIIFGHQPS
jgi:putative endonuclease